MHRLQSYWIATLLIVCLVVDFQPYKVSATPVETTTAVRLLLYVIHSEVSLLDWIVNNESRRSQSKTSQISTYEIIPVTISTVAIRPTISWLSLKTKWFFLSLCPFYPLYSCLMIETSKFFRPNKVVVYRFKLLMYVQHSLENFVNSYKLFMTYS